MSTAQVNMKCKVKETKKKKSKKEQNA